jgi:CheY-like chemotaxis protein
MQERRQTDRANSFWEQTLSALSRNLSLKQLIEMLDAEEWSYAFLLAVNPAAQSPKLLHVGPDCARTLELATPTTHTLPARHVDLFQEGCVAAIQSGRPERREGQNRLADGRQEFFRVIFIPLELRDVSQGSVAFGTFNCRRTGAEPARAADNRIVPAAPVSPAPVSPAPDSPAPVANIAGTTKHPDTVLVVDDHEAVRRTARRQLAHLGYPVIEAENAKRALAILAAEKIALLVSDVVMPGEMDGVALARKAIEDWPGIKVILISGYADGNRHPGDAPLPSEIKLLNKPYRAEELAQAVQQSLGS